jgi:hypothetical protein
MARNLQQGMPSPRNPCCAITVPSGVPGWPSQNLPPQRPSGRLLPATPIRTLVLLLAAYLSAHRTMINGSALCAALAVTERDGPGWPDCSQTVQNAEYELRMNAKLAQGGQRRTASSGRCRWRPGDRSSQGSATALATPSEVVNEMAASRAVLNETDCPCRSAAQSDRRLTHHAGGLPSVRAPQSAATTAVAPGCLRARDQYVPVGVTHAGAS